MKKIVIKSDKCTNIKCIKNSVLFLFVNVKFINEETNEKIEGTILLTRFRARFDSDL